MAYCSSHHDTTLSLSLLPPPLPNALLPLPTKDLLKQRKPKPENSIAGMKMSPSADTPPCTECGKRFRSWKALFGHMRCHPERQWRGIKPPPDFRRPHDDSATSSAVMSNMQFTVQEREVAASLLMLAGTKPRVSKAKKVPDGIAHGEQCLAPAEKCDNHKCSVCNRGFTSGQALGGHKRCHWERSTEVVVVAGGSGCASAVVAKGIGLDLNLPPPAPLPKVEKSEGTLNEMLDLKLGY